MECLKKSVGLHKRSRGKKKEDSESNYEAVESGGTVELGGEAE